MPLKTAADNIPNQISIAEPLKMPDNRILAVQFYLDKYHCGTEIDDFNMATVFVNQADQNKIDPFLLPSIWMLESTCGKRQINNNGFGFFDKKNHQIQQFKSTEDAIQFISAAITQSPYAGKNLKGIVQTYNPPSVNPNYYDNFLSFYTQMVQSEKFYDRIIPDLQDNELSE